MARMDANNTKTEKRKEKKTGARATVRQKQREGERARESISKFNPFTAMMPLENGQYKCEIWNP